MSLLDLLDNPALEPWLARALAEGVCSGSRGSRAEGRGPEGAPRRNGAQGTGDGGRKSRGAQGAHGGENVTAEDLESGERELGIGDAAPKQPDVFRRMHGRGLGGVPECARPFLVAALFKRGGRPLLVVCDRYKTQRQMAADLDAWLGPGRTAIFPERELAGENGESDPEIEAAQLAVLGRLVEEPGRRVAPWILVATPEALENPVPLASDLARCRRAVRVGAALGPEALASELEASGFVNTRRVDGRRQFSRRGGILDVFSPHAEYPVRIEFFGDTVDSIREFAVEDQLKRRDLEETVITVAHGGGGRSFGREGRETGEGGRGLEAYLGPEWITVMAAAEESRDRETRGGGREAGEAGDDDDAVIERIAGGIQEHHFLRLDLADPALAEQRRMLLASNLREWLGAGWTVAAVCNNEGEEQRLREVLGPDLGADVERIAFLRGGLARGFVFAEGGLAVLADAEIFGRYQHVRAMREDGRAAARRRAQHLDFNEWEEGDYVVHAQHGIALFLGIHDVNLGGEQDQEALVLEFANAARLYVPVEQAFLVGRYVGVGSKKPALDALGGARWDRTRAAAHKAILDYAAQLLRIEAERQAQPGFAFPGDHDWQGEFEAAFLYEPTPDQTSAVLDAKRDMESPRPMDRLVCGDVGFGKTEVAVRAAFKAVMAGKQAAFLCPTTVLARQHTTTLRERMADYPVRIEMLSRFQSPGEQKRVIERCATGEVDIVVGTHRLLSPDIAFKDLGLLVVDEEQRFGVRHKDRLKERFRQIDILTLSATPIPRTLYLALTGARDMSVIETPPPGRIPVETVVAAYDERLVRDAIRREMARDGQVFYLHNRIESIEKVAMRLRELVPGLRVLVGHGRMDDDDLEKVMLEFVEGRADVLVSTTIIESGLDIPNANTIIIDRADRFGLADLYQLRGRVGRGQQKAHAWLLLPRHLLATQEARRRAGAIRQYSHLGAGFKVAMRDLELRGAGNLLGTRQSGHVAAIGFELYCQLLKQAVEQIKTGKITFRRDVSVRLDFVALNEAEMPAPGGGGAGRLPAYLPRRFIAEPQPRIAAYRELAEAGTLEALEALRGRWADRFGRLPPEAEHLLGHARLKALCAARGADSLEVVGDQLRLKKGGEFVMPGARFPRLVEADLAERLEEVAAWVERLL